MKWLDRLLGRSSPEERAAARRELEDLHRWSDKVAVRTNRITQELLRINNQLRRQVQR